MIVVGDCVEKMREMDAGSVDAVVTDPPYGLEFMGKAWDRLENAPEWHRAWAAEALRVLKPGGHLVAFGGTRTYHELATGIQRAGFEIRDMMMWIHGQGFPKSMDVGKAIDRAAGASREVIGTKRSGGASALTGNNRNDGPTRDAWREGGGLEPGLVPVTAPATPAAKQWDGWGTALKPAHEPIVMARKPLKGTVASNVLRHGTGAINIDGCRVPGEKPDTTRGAGGQNGCFSEIGAQGRITDDGKGRWPANVIHDGEVEGFPARFYYCAKPGKAEANLGLAGIEEIELEVAWGEEVRRVRLLVASDTSRPRVTYAFGSMDATSWNIALFGSESADPFLTDWRSITGTETRPTTGSRTCNWLTGRPTSGFTPGASCETASGGSPAESAGSAFPSTTTTDERMASLLGAGPAVSGTRWTINVVGVKPFANLHPTKKPVALMRYLCRLITPPGGVILDPFLGSGTTGVAALAEGFRFLGIEREAEYAEIARQRLSVDGSSGG